MTQPERIEAANNAIANNTPLRFMIFSLCDGT